MTLGKAQPYIMPGSWGWTVQVLKPRLIRGQARRARGASYRTGRR